MYIDVTIGGLYKSINVAFWWGTSIQDINQLINLIKVTILRVGSELCIHCNKVYLLTGRCLWLWRWHGARAQLLIRCGYVTMRATKRANHESMGKGLWRWLYIIECRYLSITFEKYEAIVAPGTKKTIQWTRLQSKVGQLAVVNVKLPVCRVGAGEAWLTCSVQWSTEYVVTAPEYPSLEWGRPGHWTHSHTRTQIINPQHYHTSTPPARVDT